MLDNAFTELERDGDGRARVLLDDPASGAGLTLWVDESYRYLMLYTGTRARTSRGTAWPSSR